MNHYYEAVVSECYTRLLGSGKNSIRPPNDVVTADVSEMKIDAINR